VAYPKLFPKTSSVALRELEQKLLVEAARKLALRLKLGAKP
jgi:hypothetical protein